MTATPVFKFLSGINSVVAQSPRLQNKTKRMETRRNLYVLGLPFALTKTEFTEIFSRYGTVSHCVILATVDNASRRRGFVVMSTPEEAKLAMVSLSNAKIMDHTLDISWAVVQRSQGFLDGGDRAVMLHSHSSPTPSPVIIKRHCSGPHGSFSSGSVGSVVGERLARSLMPTSTLLVSNLPTLLFSQTVDLHPLLLPFGQIKMLNILGSPMDSGIADKMSVIVEYATFYNAQDARETLRGQCYAGCTLNAEYVRTTSHAEFGPGAAYTNGFDKYSENSVSNLNPFAPPFFLEAPQLGSFVEHFAPFHGSPKVKNHHNLYADPQYLSPYALPHPFSYMNGHLPTSRVASRSSSATSRGSNDSFHGPPRDRPTSWSLNLDTLSAHQNCHA